MRTCTSKPLKVGITQPLGCIRATALSRSSNMPSTAYHCSDAPVCVCYTAKSPQRKTWCDETTHPEPFIISVQIISMQSTHTHARALPYTLCSSHSVKAPQKKKTSPYDQRDGPVLPVQLQPPAPSFPSVAFAACGPRLRRRRRGGRAGFVVLPQVIEGAQNPGDG